MDKKPLIGGSILAVVLLVLGSLSNVVGYQTVQTSKQNIIKEKTTSLKYTRTQHKQINMFSSVFQSLKESVPSCYLVISILIFIWWLLSGIELLFEMYLSGTLQYPLLFIVYVITFSFLVGFTLPISLPLLAVFLFLIILDFIINFPPYKSVHPHFQYKFLELFKDLSISRLLSSHLTAIRN